MFKLRTALIVALFAALVFGVVGEEKRQVDDQSSEECSDTPGGKPGLPPCSRPLGSSRTTSTTTDETSNGASSPSPLERAHWCRFSNGTFLAFEQMFMHTPCTMCQCTTSRAIRCTALQCLPAYCVDNSMPARRPGQCCAQCAYETNNSSCLYNGTTFPHGTVMKSVENKMQCWCQWGNIECRSYMGLLFQGLEMMTDSTTLYIIAIVLLIVIVFGFVLCCSCTALSYQYYQRHRTTFQQAYDQYVNAAGWQPMEEAEQYEVDAGAAEKQLEAENGPYTSDFNEMVPPPYTVFDNSEFSAEEKPRK